jgi:hypothetical protein
VRRKIQEEEMRRARKWEEEMLRVAGVEHWQRGRDSTKAEAGLWEIL